MSLDLYQDESAQALSTLRPIDRPDPSVFDGFVRGTGLATMRGFARAASGIDLAGGAFAVLQDKILGSGTEAQDRYFQEHDDVLGSAVKHWTPEPNEVGMAGEVVGGLLSMLPLVIASPHLAVASTQLSTAEELVQKGVGAGKAQAVGAVQGAGLGLGIWMPILGQNLWQRVFIGGAGFNVAQGVAMRGASGVILEGTPAAEEFKAFDGKALTLDVLMGMAFGSLVHLSPAQRQQGQEYWTRLLNWAGDLDPSQVDAIAALRQSQHLNVDSAPGKLAEPKDVEAHAQRMRSAIDQLVKGEPVAVDDLPRPQFEPDAARTKDSLRRFNDLAKVAERVRQEEGIGPMGERFPASPHLNAEEQAVERRAWENLADFDKARKAYEKLPDSEGGKILNTDVARELSPDYSASKESRSMLAPAVHEPSSDFVKRLYAAKLREPSESGLNMVTFTAGGAGAGKTSAISGVPIASKISEVSDIVYDTNMNNFASAKAKIDMALDAGKQVNIMYVGRDPVDSLVNGAIPRAERMGRTVILPEHAKTHLGVSEVMGRLEEAYAGNDKVQFVYVDNTHGKGGAVIGNRELPRTFNLDNLEERLKEALDAEHEAGRVSDHVYRGIAGHEPGAAPEALAEGAGGVRGGAGGEGAERKLGPVGRAIEGQLAAVGIEKQEAAANAALWDSFFTTAGKRYGVDPAQLFQKYGVEFARTKPEDMPEAALGQGPREDVGRAAPKPGEKFIVYRLGNKQILEGRNAGNAMGVAEHLARLDDFGGPQPKGGTGDRIVAYEVTAGKFGAYDTAHGGEGAKGKAVGRRNNQGAVSYSFPKDGNWEAKPIGEIPLEEIRAELKASGFESFDDSGWLEGGKAIRKAFQKRFFQEGGRGAIQLEQGRTLIGFFENADASTTAHEGGHFFLEVTRDLAMGKDAPAGAMQDWAALSKWLELGEAGEIPRAAHEKFARGFETYLMEGRAPNPQLTSIFQQFKEWLTSVYKSVTSLGVELNPEVRGVMDRMLGVETGAPAVTRGGTEPPPPRGSSSGEAAGAEAKVDPAFAEAERLAMERPDIQVRIGSDADGAPIMRSIGDYVAEARAGAAKLREDAKLLAVAANCLLGAL